MVFPPIDTIKINSDGSTFGEHGWAAYGSLVRNGYGRWIEGFCGRIYYATPFKLNFRVCVVLWSWLTGKLGLKLLCKLTLCQQSTLSTKKRLETIWIKRSSRTAESWNKQCFWSLCMCYVKETSARTICRSSEECKEDKPCVLWFSPMIWSSCWRQTCKESYMRGD